MSEPTDRDRALAEEIAAQMSGFVRTDFAGIEYAGFDVNGAAELIAALIAAHCAEEEATWFHAHPRQTAALEQSERQVAELREALEPIMQRIGLPSKAGTHTQEVWIQASEIDALRAALAHTASGKERP